MSKYLFMYLQYELRGLSQSSGPQSERFGPESERFGPDTRLVSVLRFNEGLLEFMKS